MSDNKAVFYLYVNLSAQWEDTSHLRTNPRLKEPLPQQGSPVNEDEVVSLAVRHAEMLLQTVLDAKIKTKPRVYVFPLILRAEYPDGREAQRDDQLTSTDSEQVPALVEQWYRQKLKELVDIGSDNI